MGAAKDKIEEKITRDIENEKWGQVVIKAQLIIAGVVCLIEIVNNIILYVTRSQGYGPDTIVQKLIRYLLLTTVFNFGFVILSKIVDKKVMNAKVKRYLLMFFTTLICGDVAYSHYQFSVTFAIFVIPLVISILYEDWKLSVFTMILSLVGDIIAVITRAMDPQYNKDIGPEAAIAVSLPVCVLFFARLITSTLEKRRNEVRDAVVETQKAVAKAEKMEFSFKMLETLAGTIDAKDKYTNGHSMRVALYSTQIASALGWEEERISMLRYEALLHDIGKIGVPDAILNKPTKLTDVEFELIKSHTVVGSDILKNMVAVPGASEVARYHHERYDGHGYPNGLKEEEIPLNARIVCIADSFDAMNSDRIYRKALPRDVIREELVKGKGKQFDPQLLEVFLGMFDERKLETKQNTVFLDEDEYQEHVIEDIQKVIDRISQSESTASSVAEFEKFYKYMRNIGLRYDRTIEVLSLKLVCNSDRKEPVRLEETADILQVSIKKNIRAVDVYFKYSDTRHIIILLDAGEENIDVIQQRIQFDFASRVEKDEWSLEFKLNESNKPDENTNRK